MRKLMWAAVGALLLAACSKEPETLEPLAYVAADTPYLFANRVATPVAIRDAWMTLGAAGNVERDIERFRQALEAEAASDAESGESSAEDQAMRAALLRWLPAVAPELTRLQTPAGISEIGFSDEGRYAFYGHGLLPVLRVELASAERFAAMVARVETAAGESLAKRNIGEQTFWQLPLGKAELLFGTPGGQLVATLGPSAQEEAAWRQQLGLARPEKSLLDSDGLATLDREQGYSGHGSGWIDLRELVRRISGRSATDSAVIAAAGLPLPKPSAECLAEYDAIVARMPRIVAGATRLDAKELVMVGHLELDETLRTAMAKLPAPIPGPGAGGEGLFRFGMSMDALALTQQLGVMARAITAAPYTCEHLAPLNQMAAELGEGLKSPALGMAGAVSAMQLSLDALTLGEDGMPARLDGVLALGATMPPMLWSLAQTSLPALAEVTLSGDGKPVVLPEGLLPVPVQLQALMTSNSLALAAGEVSEDRFSAEATRPAASDGSLIYYGLRGAALAQLAQIIGQSIDQADEMPDDTNAELREAVEMLDLLAKQMQVITVRVSVDARGLRTEQQIRLN